MVFVKISIRLVSFQKLVCEHGFFVDTLEQFFHDVGLTYTAYGLYVKKMPDVAIVWFIIY